MKRTVAALALSVSTPSFALRQDPPTIVKTICLSTYETETGVQYAGNCDQAANNLSDETAVILENGCAEGQIALSNAGYPTYSKNPKVGKEKLKFDIEIQSCLPPYVAQL